MSATHAMTSASPFNPPNTSLVNHSNQTSPPLLNTTPTSSRSTRSHHTPLSTPCTTPNTQQRLHYRVNPHSDALFGDDPTHKSSDHVRFVFQNANGLPYPNSQPIDAILNKLSPLRDLQSDYTGLAETNLEFNRSDVKFSVQTAFKRLFDRSALVSTSTSTIPFQSAWKLGGTLCTATGAWCSRVISSGQDSHGLGRWSYLILRAKHNRCIALCTAYRVCQTGTNTTVGAQTAHSQQRTLL